MKNSEMGVKNVFVCGAGHQGLSMAAHLALNGVNVTLWNRTQEHIKEVIQTKEIYCQGVVEGIARIEKASSVLSDVISDFIMITTPSSAHRQLACKLAPYVSKDMVIILNPGRTFGAIDFADALLDCGVKELPHIAETQTIIYTCRKNSANSATIFALKKDVAIASVKGTDIGYIMSKMPDCLKSYFSCTDSVIKTSLSNVGMVLHCAPVLMNIGWIESEKVDFKYYYDGISPTIANFLEKIDNERIIIAAATDIKVESVADWLRRTYNVEGNNLYECIRNNEAYNEIDAPPNIKGRYLTEDVPNGLVPVEFLGKQLGIDTPYITTTINLTNAVLNYDYRKNGRTFFMEDIIKFMKKI